MVIECAGCEAKVDAKVLCEHICAPPDGLAYRYSFLCCPNCNDALVAIQEDFGGGFDIDSPFRVYPPQESKLGPSIPRAIANAYAEARSCFKAKAYTAATIMCRKTLEAICSEHDGKRDRNLVSSLKELKDKGIIENKLYEWADTLRISGNEAAHDVSVVVSPEDARDVLEFTNALLEYVFTFRDKFEEFKVRRAKRKDGEKKPSTRVLTPSGQSKPA